MPAAACSPVVETAEGGGESGCYVDVDVVDVDVVAVEPVVIAGRSGTTADSPSSGFVAVGMRGGRLDSRDCPATMPTVNHPSVVQAIAAVSHSARSAIGRRIRSAPAYRSCIVAILPASA